MKFRFRRSVKLGPGIRVNLSKKSSSVSFGTRGFHYTINPSTGQRRTTIGLPGTGMSWSKTSSTLTPNVRTSSSRPARQSTSFTSAPQPAVAPPPQPTTSSSPAEIRFSEGLAAFGKGDHAAALQAFEAASSQDERNTSDDPFAALAAAQLNDQTRAIHYLERVVASDVELPDELMRKCLLDKVDNWVGVGITPHVMAYVPFGSLLAALLLVEYYQGSGRRGEAIGVLQQLLAEGAEEVALKLSLAELLYDNGDYPEVIDLCQGLKNDSDLSLACLFFKAQALAQQGLWYDALETLNDCVGVKDGRTKELLKHIRYLRAGILEAIGQLGQAQAAWELLYADDPQFLDVASHLGRLNSAD